MAREVRCHQTDRRTDGQTRTHRPTTVTLAAHARRGLITMTVAGHIDKTCVRNARDLDSAVVTLIEHDTSFT